MERTPPSPAMAAAIAAVIAIATIYLWVVFARIWWRALKTGRLLGRGVTYDREGTPVRFWGLLIGMFVIVSIMSFGVILLIATAMAK